MAASLQVLRVQVGIRKNLSSTKTLRSFETWNFAKLMRIPRAICLSVSRVVSRVELIGDTGASLFEFYTKEVNLTSATKRIILENLEHRNLDKT